MTVRLIRPDWTCFYCIRHPALCRPALPLRCFCWGCPPRYASPPPASSRAYGRHQCALPASAALPLVVFHCVSSSQRQRLVLCSTAPFCTHSFPFRLRRRPGGSRPKTLLRCHAFQLHPAMRKGHTTAMRAPLPPAWCPRPNCSSDSAGSGVPSEAAPLLQAPQAPAAAVPTTTLPTLRMARAANSRPSSAPRKAPATTSEAAGGRGRRRVSRRHAGARQTRHGRHGGTAAAVAGGGRHAARHAGARRAALLASCRAALPASCRAAPLVHPSAAPL